MPPRPFFCASRCFCRLRHFAHALLVAPELQRDELARRGDALEALERNEALGLVQFGLQLADQRHVIREASRGGGEFEDDGDHRADSSGKTEQFYRLFAALDAHGPERHRLRRRSPPAASSTSRETRICEPNSLLSCSMREARITTSPVIEYCWRCAEPMFPETASPACRPMPIVIGGMRPAAASDRIPATSSRAAASALAQSRPVARWARRRWP